MQKVDSQCPKGHLVEYAINLICHLAQKFSDLAECEQYQSTSFCVSLHIVP